MFLMFSPERKSSQMDFLGASFWQSLAARHELAVGVWYQGCTAPASLLDSFPVTGMGLMERGAATTCG